MQTEMHARDLCNFYVFNWVNSFILYLFQLKLYLLVIYVPKIGNLCIRLGENVFHKLFDAI